MFLFVLISAEEEGKTKKEDGERRERRNTIKKRERNIERKKLRKKARVEGTIDKQDVGSTKYQK